ncbi:arylsulfatase A-like [Antedon mediterranea]|uniref:arylsulfatase A-like n=1 Tax=Antedon mediterranea TaxID=105859 RepID=UPI003AF9125B
MKAAMTYMIFRICLLLVLLECSVCRPQNKPNIVIFLADDLGYGDLQATGNPISDTPNIDILYRDGMKLTQFYSSASICSPSRAGLLTGRYPVRSGFWINEHQPTLRLNSPLGLPLNETTIAELVADQGYKSALIGKWHLGVGRNREFLPKHHGFDHFFGIPVSVYLSGCPPQICFLPDVPCLTADCTSTDPPLPLFLEDEIIEQPVNLLTLIERQTIAARSWITEFSESGNPFLLMYWFVQPHVPHFASSRFHNSTLGGDYTDSLAEMDWQIGDIITKLKEIGQFDNTLFLFTSDNGPDKSSGFQGGSSGPFRCGKSSAFEGGTRVPGVVYWPSRITPGISMELISHLDIFPTIASLIGSSVDNIQLDGYDISDVLFNMGKSPRSSLMFFNNTWKSPFAYRYNQYKAHAVILESFSTISEDLDDYNARCRNAMPLSQHEPSLLYNLHLDPEERVNIGEDKDMQSVLNQLHTARLLEESDLTYGESILHRSAVGRFQACCNDGCEPFPLCCQCVSNYTIELFSNSQRVTAVSFDSSQFAWLVAFVIIFVTALLSAIIIVLIPRLRNKQNYIKLT